jgi:hypothetical protein
MADVFRYVVVDSLDASAPKIRFVPVPPESLRKLCHH